MLPSVKATTPFGWRLEDEARHVVCDWHDSPDFEPGVEIVLHASDPEAPAGVAPNPSSMRDTYQLRKSSTWYSPLV